MREAGISGEVVVADNGSNDDSIKIAQEEGARVVHISLKGYGHALTGGIAAAKSPLILMGDADDSYDFLELPKFFKKLQEGAQLVQGCRLPAGGGEIALGAMPWSHRWIGNPLFSTLVRCWFRAPIHDVYCGMRAFTKELHEKLNLQCRGMEFATEMIIKASVTGARISEVPITLHKDGRISHPPHLRTIRDGWRTLRFFLMYSPRWLFLVPGFVLLGLAVIGFALGLGQARPLGILADAHTLLFAALCAVCGYQAIWFAVFTKVFVIREKLLPEDPRFDRLFRFLNLERGLALGFMALLAGIAGLMWSLFSWQQGGGLTAIFSYSSLLSWVIPSSTLTILGFQTILSSFLVSILGIHRE
jgi:glycosyltransferase involved in cell wall biosynthesis